MRGGLKGAHPAIPLAYLTLILTFTMILPSPLCRAASLLGACLFLVQEEGARPLLQKMRLFLPFLLLAAALNPALNHKGATILAYFPTGNPLTLEAIAYGASMALLLAALMAWFVSFQRLMTGEKLRALFGGRLPVLSLLLSMTLSLIPRLIRSFRQVQAAQEGIGSGFHAGSRGQRLKHAGHTVAILLSMAMEDALETADSMRSRGYGAAGRSTFSPYRFLRADGWKLCAIALLSAAVTLLSALGGYRFYYYPQLSAAPADLLSWSAYLVYLAFCLMPLFLEWREEQRWRSMNCQN